MQRRALWTAIIFTGFMLIYIGRLILLQINPSIEVLQPYGSKWKTENWRKASVNQRRSQIMIDDGRGQFVDDHGRTITGEQYDTAVFFPSASWKNMQENELSNLANALKHDPQELQSFLSNLRYASFYYNNEQLPISLSDEQVHRIQAMHLNGLEVVTYRNRYPKNYSHVIGMIAEDPERTEKTYATEIELENGWSRNSKVGVNGLEYSLDRYIHGIGGSYISYAIDGASRPIVGIGARVIEPSNPYYPVKVVTTIDLELQNKIERYLNDENIQQGAVVLLDVTNGDIKAMVSRPQLLPGQLKTGQDEMLRNHALTAFAPGSIYKIVTAAAALEYGVTTEHETFHCNGEYGKYGLSCWNPKGHGEQTLKEAFANSCNVVFATLSERLTAQQIYNTASALGVLQKVGWHTDRVMAPLSDKLRLLSEEEEGKLFYNIEQVDGGILAQSGIGQRDVRISPLQAANMMVTLLHGGQQYENRVVSQITYQDGQVMAELPVHKGHENKYALHPQTAEKILEYIQAVVEEGTATNIKQGIWKVAGKSGTAQLSGDLTGNNHQWFVGYGPVEQPKYALAVLVEQQPSGTRNKATKLFRGIMDIVADYKP